jgi:5-formyltetrahydrofolate cyclo-ligase
MTAKAQLRAEIEHKRKALDLQWQEDASARIFSNLQSLEIFQSSETVALYMAVAGEVRLDPLLHLCWKLGKRTCIPVFNPRLKIYEMAGISAETRFETGHYGIREPVDPRRISVETIDLMVVPGVAFDRNGNRLGRGGGYYDRFLKGFSGYSVGVAFDFQLLPEVPHNSHDIPVGIVVSETNIVEVKNER